MGKVYKYDKKRHTIKNYPTRADAYSNEETLDLDEMKEFIFHPVDISTAYSRYIYGKPVRGYTLIISGTLSNGDRVQVIISDISLYFDVRLTNKLMIREVKELLNDSYTDIKIVKAYPGIGFHKEMASYLRVYFGDIYTRRKYLKELQEKKFETASDTEMFGMPNEIINRNEWTLGDWVIVRNYESKWVDEYKTWAVYITESNDNYIPVNKPLSSEPPKTKVPIQAPYLSCGYDIEVNGESFALPTPQNIKEKVFMLCYGIYRSDQMEPVYSGCITNQTYIEDIYMTKNPEWDLILCNGDDDEVILAFADILKRFYPEYRLAFNQFGFDDPFICERINQKQYDKFDLFANMALPMPYEHIYPAKRKMIDTLYIETKIKLDGVFDTSGTKKRLHLPGTLNIDMMIALKKMNPKDDMLASHGLRSYLERYNLPAKLDMTPAEMNECFAKQDEVGMYDTAEYCVVDSLSCVRLEQKVSLIASYHATAHLALCSIPDAFIRAGGMKVKNVIYCIGRRMQCNYTENPKKIEFKGKFPGAVVFAPLKGLYNDQPTIALDFASLYPSIMRALWISSETYLEDSGKAEELRQEGYDVFDFHLKWTYPELNEELKETVEKKVDKKVYYVRKTPDGDNCRGVYPVCLEFLAKTRKMYKNKMAEAGRKIAKLQKQGIDDDEMKEAIIEEKDYNQKQLATKIVMNTLYGSIGMKAFNLYNVYLASTITLFGQKSIKASSEVATKQGYVRLYGDSFVGNTPLIFRHEHITIMRIDEFDNYSDWNLREDGKEYMEIPNLEVWEKDRFVKVNQIIRHKTDKTIMRVGTHCGIVDVTTDHSLYNEMEEKISPEEVIVKETKLLTSNLDSLVELIEENSSLYEEDYNLDTIRMMGMILGRNGDKVIDDIPVNHKGENVIPGEILLSTQEVVKSFVEGFILSNSEISKNINILTIKTKEMAMNIIILLKRIGLNNYQVFDTIEGYKIVIDATIEDDTNLVMYKHIFHPIYTDYVYDLNTETGKHHAGLGDIVVSNTDSIFLLPKKEMLEGIEEPRMKVKKCQDLADKLLTDIRAEIRAITRRDTNVINMELDKLLYPALYCGKKKYYAIIWEGDKEPEEYISGLEFKKRGKSQLLVDLSQRVVTESMKFDFSKDMLEFVVDVLQDGVEEIKQKPIEYFAKKIKYRPGKAGSANMFIERMRIKEKVNPILYQLPDPNVTFEYVITSLIDPFMSNGNRRAVKKTDQWEFLHVVNELNLKPDYSYYLEDVIGSLARFINYYQEFQPEDSIDIDEIDKKAQKNAEKYLKNRLDEFNQVSTLKHTIIKKQRKYVNSIYRKIYAGLVDYFMNAYDDNIDVDGITEYILLSTKNHEYPIELPMTKDKIEEMIKHHSNYIISKTSIIENLYRGYMKGLDEVSYQEKDLLFDLDPLFRKNTVENPVDIIDSINELIKYNSAQESDVDPVKDALDIVFS